MLVYEEMANDLHSMLSRTEKSRHFVICACKSHNCARCSRAKFCAVGMRNAKLRNHPKGLSKIIKQFDKVIKRFAKPFERMC